MLNYESHPFLDEYIEAVESNAINTSKEIKQMIKLVKSVLQEESIIIDHEKIDTLTGMINRYFPFKLLMWQRFLIATMFIYKEDGQLRFNEFLLLMGRGNGKNGFISALIFALSTHYHGIKEYNIDIVANSEAQAQTSFDDVYAVLDTNWDKLKHFFYKTKMKIVNTKTNSYIKFNTSNARTKDGLRPACVIFDEIHENETYDNIKVFTSGLGKKKHSRTFFITTNGYVRGGVLDDYLDLSEKILTGEAKAVKMLPMLYKMDSEEEISNPDMWEKSNPSIHNFPHLKEEITNTFEKMKYQPQLAVEFYTKRMNMPAQSAFTVAAEWEQILATEQPFDLEEFKGMQCVGAIDYAEIKDFCSVGLLFKKGGKRYWHEHTFVCHKALKVTSRPIKFDVDTAVKKGLITIIYDESIKAHYIAKWFLDNAKNYKIQNISTDSFRAAILEDEFAKHGLPLQQVRSGPITHSKLAPLVDVMFANKEIVFGDNMTMRWYTNNVYVDMDAKGNKTYKKIEPQTRKTDGFFAFLHALCIDDNITERRRMKVYKSINM